MKGISMKAMRYIWIVAMLSMLCGTVQAVTYGKSYKPRPQHHTAYFHAQASTGMPAVRMGSVNATTMYSGSSLPLAAATGVTTSYDNNPSNVPGRPGRPRRVGENEGFEEEEKEPEVPVNPFPLGDALLPMMLMAILFAAFITLRRKRSERVNG